MKIFGAVLLCSGCSSLSFSQQFQHKTVIQHPTSGRSTSRPNLSNLNYAILFVRLANRRQGS